MKHLQQLPYSKKGCEANFLAQTSMNFKIKYREAYNDFNFSR